jgi:hypothetical protein
MDKVVSSTPVVPMAVPWINSVFNGRRLTDNDVLIELLNLHCQCDWVLALAFIDDVNSEAFSHVSS